jgi:hypothetical protein
MHHSVPDNLFGGSIGEKKEKNPVGTRILRRMPFQGQALKLQERRSARDGGG